MKVNIELAFFFAVLLVITGTFLALQETASITGAAISTLPVEEQEELPSVPEVDSNTTNSSAEQIIEKPIETDKKAEKTQSMITEKDSSLGIQQIEIQAIPAITLVLNTTNISKNDTDTNLTAYNTTQFNGTSLKVIYNWLRNATSITVLNMPFEGINNTAFNNTHDYSGRGNNGSALVNAYWNATGGYDGKGAYKFNMTSNSAILIGNNSFQTSYRSICTTGCTINAWIYPYTGLQSNRAIVARARAADGIFTQNLIRFGIQPPGSHYLFFTIGHNASSNTRTCTANAPDFSIINETWQFVTARYNLTHTAVFINGTQKGVTACSFDNVSADLWASSAEPIIIGAERADLLVSFFNGTIDDVMVFNRSLSAEQIFALFQNKTNVIVPQETLRFENWTVIATPNNGTGDGTVVISNNVTILNAKPVISPLVLNTTNVTLNNTEVNLTAYANTSDIDGDSVKVIYNWLRNGTSITVLNMPFEGVNNSNTLNAYDYSGFGNNGSENNGALWNATGGYDEKGAYEFDGIDDHIKFVDTTSLNLNESMTLVAWINSNPDATQQEIIWHGNGGIDYGLRRLSTGELRAVFTNTSTSQLTVTSTSGILDNVWLHTAVVYDLNNSNLSLYINGIFNASTAAAGHGKLRDSGQFMLGNFFPTSNTGYNGTIDEVLVFNKSLSSEQIFALWQNKTNITVAQETTRADNWTVQATPNDGFEDGAMVTSSNVTILNTKPVISPLVLNTTDLLKNETLVNLTAYANTTDFENDSVKVIYNWLRNGTSIAVLNMPFEGINRTSGTVGKALDYSGYQNNASEQGNVRWNSSDGHDGKGAYQFDGADDYLEIPDSATLRPTAAITIAVWVKPNLTQSALLVDKLTTVGGSDGYSLNLISGQPQLNIGSRGVAADQSLTDGVFNHVAAVYDGSRVTMYINGISIGTGAVGGDIPTNSSVSLRIGIDHTGTNDFNGTIDDLFIFNRSLSPEQVFALYQNQTHTIVSNETITWENWTVQATPNDGFEDGTMILSGNVTIVDKTAPTVTITNPANGSNFSARTQTFAATVTDTESGVSTVLFMFNTNATRFNVTATAQGGGSFSTTANLSVFPEGLHSAIAFANDTVNNINQTVNVSFTVDLTTPNVTLNFLNNPVNDSNFSIRSSNKTFNASIFDNVTQVDFVYFWFENGTGKDFNITGTNRSGQWSVSYNVSTLAEGRQGIRIVANDTVNNINNTFVINFTVDLTAPLVTFAAPAAGTTLSSMQSFNATINDNLTGVDTVIFQFTNGTNPFNRTASNSSGTWNVSVETISIEEGALTVTIFANDSVGNLNSTQTLAFEVDNIPLQEGGGGSSGGGVKNISKPVPEYICGNGVLENGEQCDSGEGCSYECTCLDGYNSVKEIDCEKLSYCGDGIVNQAAEECDSLDFNQQTCVTKGYTEGKLSCTKECTFDLSKCLILEEEIKEPEISKGKVREALKAVQHFLLNTVEKLLQASFVKKSNRVLEVMAGKIGGVAVQYAIYWLLLLIVIIILITALHIKDMPVPEFLWKMKPIPQVRVKEPPVTIASPTIGKTDIHLRDWGKKNYLDLQQELKLVEALIKETPLPEQKSKPLKLTSLKTMPTQSRNQAMQKTPSIQVPKEVEQWVGHLFASGTPMSKIITIVKNSTSLSDTEIKSVLTKIKAARWLEKKYALNQQNTAELQKFIRTERKKGVTIDEIVADLVQEGWDEKTIRLYVTAYYS